LPLLASQTIIVRQPSKQVMAEKRDCEVTWVDRIGRGIVVSFSDGRSVLFSAELLCSLRHLAHEIREEPGDGYAEPTQGAD